MCRFLIWFHFYTSKQNINEKSIKNLHDLAGYTKLIIWRLLIILVKREISIQPRDSSVAQKQRREARILLRLPTRRAILHKSTATKNVKNRIH
ncbi:MAG: hypothetical protein B6244_06680 [Candidatus Cloacimonetes bacterium 4572_55]|nr:MAG: hypothetical protein B6244_06680 [Candidatus Cloacimonetes bacterium 4572_55]